MCVGVSEPGEARPSPGGIGSGREEMEEKKRGQGSAGSGRGPGGRGGPMQGRGGGGEGAWLGSRPWWVGRS